MFSHVGKESAVNSANKGTKCAAWYKFTVQPGASATVRCRLTHKDNNLHGAAFGKPFDDLFAQRITEADVFYEEVRASFLNFTFKSKK